MKTTQHFSFLAASMFALIGAMPAAHADGDYRAKAMAMIKNDFVAKGQASADRVNTDGLQTICNRTGF